MSFHNRLFFISIFLFFLTVNTLAFTKHSGFRLSWRNCGPSTDPIQLKSLAITPDPIRVPGNFNITGSVDIGAQIPTDVHVTVLLERKVGPFFVKVPCVDNFGSCNYGNACDLWAEYCPKYAARYGLPCQCPISAGTYSVSDASNGTKLSHPTQLQKKAYERPAIYSAAPVIFVNVSPPPELLGEYRATADIGSRESHLGCVNIDLTIKK